MRITFSELQNGHLISDIPITAQQKMEVLLIAINKIRDMWGKPMKVTSGFRDEQDQKRINPKVLHSRHCEGNAVDIADPDGSLYQWAHANQDKLELAGLWCEAGTKGWLHFQSVPFGSYKPGGTRFFNP